MVWVTLLDMRLVGKKIGIFYFYFIYLLSIILNCFRWRLVLALVSVCVAVGAVYWLGDPATAQVTFLTSLWLHPLFSLSSITMVVLFFMGVHRRVVQTSIVLSRMREVLFDFSMDCDDTGKLILKPRPASA